MSDTKKDETMQRTSHTSATFGSESAEDANGRDRWPSRTAFYLAAVGSAVGFGNVWRFPALAKDYGGGAFFIPYLLALFLIGLPVLILEISIGQVHQTGNVGVFGTFHARFRGVGVASVAAAFMLVVYYSALLSWVTNAFFDSFGDSDPWAEDGTTGGDAVEYFFNEIIGLDTVGDDLRPTRVVGANAGYGALVWVCIWLCLAFGMKWTGRIAYFTMGLPILLLFMFLIKGLTLTGAPDGIKAYIGEWDMSVLTERPDVWSTAVSQIFFSLSVTMGTMTAYGSHCPTGEPAFTNSVVIGFSNSMFSFIAGLAVFAAMGHLAHLEDKDVDDIPYGGFSLVFGTWPVVFGTFKGGEHWVRLLFFNLFLLGIDSAFSILEGPITVMMDFLTKSKRPYPKWVVSGAFCIVAYLLSIMYATDAGLFFLDTIDFYINFSLLLVGFLETLGAGWIHGIEDQIANLGAAPVLTYFITNFLSVIVASSVWFNRSMPDDNQVWGGFLALFLVAGAGLMVTFYFLAKKKAQEPDKWTWSSIVYELGLKNVMDLRESLESTVGWMPWLWALMIKCFCPHVLLILFINLTLATNVDGEPLFGNYGNFVKWPFQILGMACVGFIGLLFLIGALVPSIFEGADLTTLEQEAPSKVAAGEEMEENEKPSDNSSGGPEDELDNDLSSEAMA